MYNSRLEVYISLGLFRIVVNISSVRSHFPHSYVSRMSCLLTSFLLVEPSSLTSATITFDIMIYILIHKSLAWFLGHYIDRKPPIYLCFYRSIDFLGVLRHTKNLSTAETWHTSEDQNSFTKDKFSSERKIPVGNERNLSAREVWACRHITSLRTAVASNFYIISPERDFPYK